MKEILLTSPRVSAELIQDGCNEAFQDAFSDVVDSFSSVVVNCCKLVCAKKSQSNSGKKLKRDALKSRALASPNPSLRRLLGLF